MYYDDQLASFTTPASHSSRVILYEAGSWVGRYSGVPVARIILLGVTSGRPGTPVAYTNEFSPSVGYTGAGGGQSVTVALTQPYLTTANYDYTVGLMNSHSSAILGVAMYQAQDISENNESFYRKDNFGTTPVEMGGSAVTNEGQLVAWFNGEVNVAPNNPSSLSPSGANLNIGRNPTLTAVFEDANRVLNNGVAWDRVTRTRVWLRTGSTSGANVFTPKEWANNSTEQANRKSSVSTGLNLSYGVTYYYGVQHQDRGGLWSNVTWVSFSIKDPNDPPSAPDSLTPSGSVVSSLTPSMRFRHRDPNGNNSSKARIEVQTSGGSARWDYTWSVAVANNGYITRTYAGNALAYGTSYRFRTKTWDSAGYEGAWSGWQTFTLVSPNTAPYAPDQISPNGSITGDLTPLLSMRHRDPDGNSTSNAKMQVRRKSDNTMMLDKVWATSVAHNGYVNRNYDGLTLAYNTTYQFRGQTQDSAGAWGGYSAWVDFTITSLSSVDEPTSPSGWQATTTPANVVAVYRHNSGVSSQAFRVRLLNSTGSTIATSAWVNKTVANGGVVTLTWAELGFGARAWGANEQVIVQSRDANGVESPSWSPASKFNINAAPSVPSGLTPNGSASPALPKLIVTNVTDADTVQDPKSSLIVKAVLTTSAGTFTRTMTWVAASNRWEYQTTVTELPAKSTFQNTWQAYAGDGSVWSGGKNVEAEAVKSGVATFVYDAVPEVLFNGPASPIETTQPTITWLVDQPQQSYRVRGYMGEVLVYDSGTVTSTTPSHLVIPGNFLGGEAWNTGETITFEISVTSTSAITGTSTPTDILLDYTPPGSLPLFGEAVPLPQTTQPSAFLLWHEPTAVLNENFEGYVWSRWEIDDVGNEVAGSRFILKFITNPAHTTLLDAEVESHKRYRWSVFVRERRGNDIVSSAPSTFEGSVQWDGIILHAPHNPEQTAVELNWSTAGDDYRPQYQWLRNSLDFEAVNGERIFSIGKKIHTDSAGSFEIINDDVATAEQRLATLHYLYRLQGGEIDGEPHTACWRSGRGGVNGIVYGMLTDDPNITFDDDGWYMLDIGIRSAAYTFGYQGEID